MWIETSGGMGKFEQSNQTIVWKQSLLNHISKFRRATFLFYPNIAY